MRETPGWSRHLGWLMVLLTILLLGAASATAAEPKKFTLINVVLDGTKIWLPSSLMVTCFAAAWRAIFVRASWAMRNRWVSASSGRRPE